MDDEARKLGDAKFIEDPLTGYIDEQVIRDSMAEIRQICGVKTQQHSR